MSDFKKGQQVIHCRDGLGVIVDETVIADNGYFVVKTSRGAGENIYVPISRADVIIRPLLTKEEAMDLIKYINELEVEFNPNTKQRRDAYKKRLSSGNVKDIAYLYRQLYFYNAIGGENNEEIKLGPVDLDMLGYATNMLLDELTISYKQPRENIEAFIEKRIASL